MQIIFSASVTEFCILFKAFCLPVFHSTYLVYKCNLLKQNLMPFNYLTSFDYFYCSLSSRNSSWFFCVFLCKLKKKKTLWAIAVITMILNIIHKHFVHLSRGLLTFATACAFLGTCSHVSSLCHVYGNNHYITKTVTQI